MLSSLAVLMSEEEEQEELIGYAGCPVRRFVRFAASRLGGVAPRCFQVTFTSEPNRKQDAVSL